MKWAFCDVDAAIEKSIGTSIANFFQMEGEGPFREIEAATLDDLLTKKKRSILATGGGAVLNPISRENLPRRSFVIYLFATPEEVHIRLGRDDRRPLLKVDDPLGKLKELFVQRDCLYREISHIVVPIAGGSVPKIVAEILRRLNSDCSATVIG
jgi:shikimate kinase